MRPNPLSFSAVILAGGLSRRMGRDKAFLEANGRQLLARQIDAVRHLEPVEIYISGRPGTNYGEYDCPIIHDAFPGSGPLAGIERALHLMHDSLLLVLAVDMPAMTGEYLRKLTLHCADRRGVVPRLTGRIEPLAAIYPKASHVIARTMLQEGYGAVCQFAQHCAESGLVSFVDVPFGMHGRFANWNSPGDVSPL